MLEFLKKSVLEANLEIEKRGLITFTWGNVSAIDREKGLVVIKPSGVEYCDLSVDKMVVIDLQGNVVEGNLNPSTDTPTHLEIYNNFEEVGGVVHTHSRWATIWAQSGKNIPPLGTTHADYFFGEIPCTRMLTNEQIQSEYEKNTGKIICDEFIERNPMFVPAALVLNHGAFAWGKDAKDAVHNAVVLEEVAMMAYHTLNNNPSALAISEELLRKHFFRKHGEDAYYGN
ncbi:MAG: L-ribulose-5-phosphate 4-epimerase [Bacillota bacterium]